MLVLFLDLVLPPSHPTPPRVNWKRPLLKSAQLWKAIFIDFKSKTKAVFPDAGTGSGNSLRNAKGSKVCFIPREEKSLMKHNQPTAEGNGTSVKLSIGFQPHFDVMIIIAQPRKYFSK